MPPRHSTHVTQGGDRRKWRAFCSCGVVSPEFDTESAALTWASHHMRSGR
jgi:hypothetical protein